MYTVELFGGLMMSSDREEPVNSGSEDDWEDVEPLEASGESFNRV